MVAVALVRMFGSRAPSFSKETFPRSKIEDGFGIADFDSQSLARHTSARRQSGRTSIIMEMGSPQSLLYGGNRIAGREPKEGGSVTAFHLPQHSILGKIGIGSIGPKVDIRTYRTAVVPQIEAFDAAGRLRREFVGVSRFLCCRRRSKDDRRSRDESD